MGHENSRGNHERAGARPAFPVFGAVALVGGLCLVATLARPLRAEPMRGQGGNTGDGSTVFTGLAQAPEANLFVGSATTSVPIDVPPGRANMTPKLALVYNSGAGPGPFGYGWDLPLGRIQRSGKHGVLSCNDPTRHRDFVLTLPGASVECTLEPNPGNPNDWDCLPAVEESYLTIRYRRDANYWEVWDKSGLQYVFGRSASARSGSGDTFFDAANCRYTSAWALESIEDPNGNNIEVTYTRSSPDNPLLYPAWLHYGGNRRTSLHHLFSVQFGWDTRPAEDQLVGGTMGVAAKLELRLSWIAVLRDYRPNSTVASPITGNLIRSYSFSYHSDRQGRQSLLRAVTLLDGRQNALARADGAPASTLFDYQDNVAAGRFGFRSAYSIDPLPVATPTIGRRTKRFEQSGVTVREIFDVDGDGISDLVDITAACDGTAPVWDVYAGNAAAEFRWRKTSWDVSALPHPCWMRRYQVVDVTDTRVREDTLDLTGDGIPDFVSSDFWTPENPYWFVYPGQRLAEGGGGFGTPVLWPAGHNDLHRTLGDQDYLGWYGAGSGDIVDLVDLNGDGLLDQLDASTATAWYNTGNGFGAATHYFLPFRFLRYSNSHGLQVLGFADMNGDGLPDQAVTWDRNRGVDYDGYWRVYANTGHGISAVADKWDLSRSACTGDEGRATNGLRQANYDGTDVVRDFFDINGDGLPDVVETCGYSTSHPYWKVYLNRGAGFSAALDWSAPSGGLGGLELIRDFDDQFKRGGGRTYADTFDANGDGLVDFVRFDAGNAWRVSMNAGEGACLYPGPECGGRPDLLTHIQNGIDGDTFLAYWPSTLWDNTTDAGLPGLPFVNWTLAAIVQHDGLCPGPLCRDETAHEVTRQFDYAYGLYDFAAREFRGFRTVQQSEAAGGTRVVSYFHQDAARKGKLDTRETYVDGEESPRRTTVNQWECVESSCSDPSPQGVTVTVRQKQSTSIDWPTTGPSGMLLVNRNLAWDECGNVTHSEKLGTGTTPVFTRTEYACRLPAEAGRPRDRPVHVVVGERGGAAALEEKWFLYDSENLGSVRQGRATRVYAWLDRTVSPRLPSGSPCPATPTLGTGACTETRMSYDHYGNLVTVIAANNNQTDTVYDYETQIYPITVYNGGYLPRHMVSTTYDPACGVLLRRSVPYPQGRDARTLPATETGYDTFCRPVEIREPYPGTATPQPRRRMAYLLGGPSAGTAPVEIATSQTVRGNPLFVVSAAWSEQRRYLDALGRPVQQAHTAYVDRQNTVVVDALTEYDDMGRPRSRFGPFVSGGFAMAESIPSDSGLTRFSYDGLGRPTRIDNPDGTYRTLAYDTPWQTSTSDECHTGGTCPGSRVVERRDAFGRTIERTVFEKAAGNAAETVAARSRTRYDGLGRVVETCQGTSTTPCQSAGPDTRVVTVYDSLGRKLEMRDPDSGTWRYGYDLAGNLLYQDDPAANQHLEYRFDELGRPIEKYACTGDDLVRYPCRSGPADVALRYDTYDPAAGLYDDGWDGVSAHERLTSVVDASGSTFVWYDIRGRTARTRTTIHPPGEGRSTADWSYAYDIADHPTTIYYPDGERLRYIYDYSGRVASMRGRKSYLRRVTYDMFGRPRSIDHGNRVTDRHEYGGAAGGHRLQRIDVARRRDPILSYAYTEYTATGRLKHIEDLGVPGLGAVLNNSATFEYDGLGRLVRCSGPNYPGPHNTYSFDALGNLAEKEGMELRYAGSRPHAPTETMSDGVHTAIQHDDNGNRFYQGLPLYRYDAEDRLVSYNDGEVEFLYNYAGERVAKTAAGVTTRYYGKLAEASQGMLTKYYVAEGMLIASARVATVPLARLEPGAGQPAVEVAGGGGESLRLVFLLRSDVQRGLAIFLSVGVLAAMAIPGRRRAVVGIRIRRGPVLVLIVALVSTTLPVPYAVRPAAAAIVLLPTVQHYHTDHLGSVQAVTDRRGKVIEHIRYRPYGEVRGHYLVDGTQIGSPCAQGGYCRQFTGYDSEPISGLQYAGARFYDPAMGMFLTHDPARQFASPYTYTNGNPTNLNDPNGEIVIEFVVAVLIAAAVSAGVSSAVAAAQGASLGQIGRVAAMGAVTGAIGVGLGVVASGVNIGLASLAGTLPQEVGLAEAMNALGEVAYRSAFSTIAATTTGQAAAAAGAPDGAVTGLSIAAGYGASYAYDSNFVNYDGDLARIEGKGAFQNVSNRATHTNLTARAAQEAGYLPAQVDTIVGANLARDGVGEPFGRQLSSWLGNQDHFGFGAQSAFRYFRDFLGNPKSLTEFLKALGSASHHLQDQYALGHIFPGTNLLAGAPGAPFRFLLHQTFGGEVTFIDSSRAATRSLFTYARGLGVAA